MDSELEDPILTGWLASLVIVGLESFGEEPT